MMRSIEETNARRPWLIEEECSRRFNRVFPQLLPRIRLREDVFGEALEHQLSHASMIRHSGAASIASCFASRMNYFGDFRVEDLECPA